MYALLCEAICTYFWENFSKVAQNYIKNSFNSGVEYIECQNQGFTAASKGFLLAVNNPGTCIVGWLKVFRAISKLLTSTFNKFTTLQVATIGSLIRAVNLVGRESFEGNAHMHSKVLKCACFRGVSFNSRARYNLSDSNKLCGYKI